MKNKIRYELKEVVSDYGIYEDGKLKLILNDYMNAKYIIDILQHDSRNKRYPNMITLLSLYCFSCNLNNIYFYKNT